MDPGAGALLNGLLRDASPCLHVAVAGRRLPDGPNVSGAVLGSGAEVPTEDDIARFHDLALSRRQLAAVVDNWIAGRFRDGFADADRQPVLDAGLFDRLDAGIWRGDCLFLCRVSDITHGRYPAPRECRSGLQ